MRAHRVAVADAGPEVDVQHAWPGQQGREPLLFLVFNATAEADGDEGVLRGKRDGGGALVGEVGDHVRGAEEVPGASFLADVAVLDVGHGFDDVVLDFESLVDEVGGRLDLRHQAQRTEALRVHELEQTLQATGEKEHQQEEGNERQAKERDKQGWNEQKIRARRRRTATSSSLVTPSPEAAMPLATATAARGAVTSTNGARTSAPSGRRAPAESTVMRAGVDPPPRATTRRPKVAVGRSEPPRNAMGLGGVVVLLLLEEGATGFSKWKRETRSDAAGEWGFKGSDDRRKAP